MGEIVMRLSISIGLYKRFRCQILPKEVEKKA
jgi:hypothetical protein